MYKNPYQSLEKGQWLKVNFHAHAGTGPNTCGENPVDKVIELYKRNKFDALMISNHDIFTDTSAYTSDDILMINGVEYSARAHMLTIGVDKSLHELDHQSAIDATASMGGMTVLCHPNWPKKEYWSWDSIDKLRGFIGIEVINMLIYRLRGSGFAADTWDHILSGGRLIYGFGNDDFHIYSDAARSYNWIYCKERSYDSIKAAVERGALCASTGLMPEYLRLDGDTIKVKAKFQTDTYVDTFTYRFVAENGRVVSVQEGSAAEYKLNGEKYIRVEAVGENGALLFFQPVYQTGAFL